MLVELRLQKQLKISQGQAVAASKELLKAEDGQVRFAIQISAHFTDLAWLFESLCNFRSLPHPRSTHVIVVNYINVLKG